MDSALGIMRRWIQHNALNGDRVIWGSNDVLHFNRVLGVRDLEEIAIEIMDYYDKKSNEK